MYFTLFSKCSQTLCYSIFAVIFCLPRMTYQFRFTFTFVDSKYVLIMTL